MRKTLSRILHLYKLYRAVSWALGLILAIVVPLMGYAIHAFGIIKIHRQIAADDPETATGQTIGTPLAWITAPDNPAAAIAVTSLIVGVILILLLLIIQTTVKTSRDPMDVPQADPPIQDRYGDGYTEDSRDDRYDEIEDEP